MERKIGEIFEYKGKKLQVREGENCSCHDCFFDRRCTLPVIKMTGECAANCREDNKGVVFVEVQEVQELNLCEILKDCPNGEPFWSPMLGEVKLHNIDHEEQKIYVILKTGALWYINADGTLTVGGVISSEIMIYPSRTQKSWTDVKYKKKERFNPKTLKPFDRVLARLADQSIWCCELFSFVEDDTNLIKCCGVYYKYCVPYNDDTKHLVGTKDKAPEYYRYWEE